MTRATRLSLILLLVTKSALWAEESGLNPTTLDVFEHFQDSIPAIRGVLADIDSAPEWSLIARNKESYGKELDSHLDEAIANLLPEGHAAIRDELFSLDSDLTTLREEMFTLDAERSFGGGGPERDSELEMTLRSLMGEGVSRVVFGQNLETRIRELESRRMTLISDFRRYMNQELSMELTARQCESLLYQVNGKDLVDAIAAAKVLSELEEHLRDAYSRADKDFSRTVQLRYYRLALIVRLTIMRLTERHLQNYDEKYLPALAELEFDNDRLRTDNLHLLTEVDDREQDRVKIEHVVRALDLARRAIDLYRHVLERSRDKSVRMLEDARRSVKLAQATLQTLEHVAKVQDVASGALKEFDALSELEAPDLLPLDDKALYDSLLDISRSLNDRLES